MDLLNAGEVHIVYGMVDEFKSSLQFLKAKEIMSAEEKKQHLKFSFEEDRDLYLLARYLLRSSLSNYHCEILPTQWTFKFNSYGRPSISNVNGPPNLHFNISHSDGMVVCGFASFEEIGVDVENRTRKCSHLELAKNQFSIIEFENLKSFAVHEQSAVFFKFWTLKEAYIKARGLGLQLPLEQFSFLINDESDIKILFDIRMNENPSRWKFKLLYPKSPYQVAIAMGCKKEIRIVENFKRF